MPIEEAGGSGESFNQVSMFDVSHEEETFDYFKHIAEMKRIEAEIKKHAEMAKSLRSKYKEMQVTESQLWDKVQADQNRQTVYLGDVEPHLEEVETDNGPSMEDLAGFADDEPLFGVEKPSELEAAPEAAPGTIAHVLNTVEEFFAEESLPDQDELEAEFLDGSGFEETAPETVEMNDSYFEVQDFNPDIPSNVVNINQSHDEVITTHEGFESNDQGFVG